MSFSASSNFQDWLVNTEIDTYHPSQRRQLWNTSWFQFETYQSVNSGDTVVKDLVCRPTQIILPRQARPIPHGWSKGADGNPLPNDDVAGSLVQAMETSMAMSAAKPVRPVNINVADDFEPVFALEECSDEGC